ncbi:MAG: A/G-specific adenine glycosylase [Halothiobacillaceae bacterium]
MNDSRASLTVSPESAALFAARLLAWWQNAGRHDLPWQSCDNDAEKRVWRVWVSEVMLQQTQVVTVIPYFLRFMQRFPDVASFARATEDEVLAHWAGLGYYRRARLLHAAAKQVVERHSGIFPRDFAAALALPGLGRSTAGAVLAQAFDLALPILDGNVKRVLARYFALEGWPGSAAIERILWRYAESLMPSTRAADYTQAMMDLGATLCTPRNPDCIRCPQEEFCLAKQSGRVSELPTPRPRKVLPVRQVVMWLVEGEGGVLLQRRPPVGIWPGLYSFPESSVGECFPGIEPIEADECLPVMRHTFSHYHLDIFPHRARWNNPAALVMDDDALLWYKPKQSEIVGVPAPVRRLLDLYV